VTRIKLKFVDTYVDANGKRRFYVRLSRSSPRITLPGEPGSTQFMRAYEQATQGAGKLESKRGAGAGTFDRLVLDYLQSPDYLRLAPSTRRSYRLVVERWLRDEGVGHRLVAQMTRTHIDKTLARRAATPGAANDVLKKIKILIRFAIDRGWRKDDPTKGVKRFAEGEFHTWSEAEIAQYERRWSVGSKERMAFALLLYTGQRRSDVVRMSWRDIDGGAIRVAQLKTRVKLEISLHPQLMELLAIWPKDHVVILTTIFGKPFSAPGFGNWMADKIAAAGLPDECVTHGLRKAAARRLAEAGCSTLQIMAVTGHRSLAEVERYTRGAQQKRLAQEAIKQLSDGSGTKIP
jgi:integrase